MSNLLLKDNYSILSQKPIKKIGVYDSGIGGFSVLESLFMIFPAHYVYFADTAYFPYGAKTPDVLAVRIETIINFFIEQEVDVVIVACNTVAASVYEKNIVAKGIPIITIIDFLAHQTLLTIHPHKELTLGLMATPATIASGVYQRLLMLKNPEITLIAQACQGLADVIEHGAIPEIIHLVDLYTRPFIKAKVDAILLACTHYHFIKKELSDAVGSNVPLICICQKFPQVVMAGVYSHIDRSTCTFFVSDQKFLFEKKMMNILKKNIFNCMPMPILIKI